jgi:hypothetical protein
MITLPQDVRGVLLVAGLAGVTLFSSPAPLQATRIRQITLPTKDLLYDALRRRIYASVPSSAGAIGNSITTIDPFAATVGQSVWIGSEPGQIVITDNGQYLYVGLDGAAAVRRFHLATLTAGLQFSLGSDSFSGPRYVDDLVALPAAPESVAVSRMYLMTSHAGVAIYDNGVPRPVATPENTGPDQIEASMSGSVLYGIGNNGTVYRLGVSASGVAITNSYAGLSNFGDVKSAVNRLYVANSGRVINPETGAILGTYAVAPSSGNRILPDPQIDRVYFVTGSGSSTTIRAFAKNSFLPLGTIPIPAASGTPTSLIRWGQNGLAFRTTANQVFLIETPLIPVPDPAADFDEDERTDLAVWRPSEGMWYIQHSTTSAFRAEPFGANTDRIVPGDYDGDGKTDVAVWRSTDGVWYLIESGTGTFRATQFGASADLPVHRDYDGDGKTDIAVYRPGEGVWYVLPSSSGTPAAAQFGVSTDKPVPGDYDGDGRVDFAVYRPTEGNWYVLESSTASLRTEPFGIGEDLPLPRDYDGDAKTDVAVYRPSSGVWYVRYSSNGIVRGFTFGLTTDLRVPGDYDGDRKADLAVYRSGVWHVWRSSDNTLFITPFGVAGDIPVPFSFDQ